jgi:hypothetical protein
MRAFHEINLLINKIKNVCDDNGLLFEEFIEVNHNFE